MDGVGNSKHSNPDINLTEMGPEPKPSNNPIGARSLEYLADPSEKGYLTREELEEVTADQPIWRRIRIAFVIAFFVIWFGLIAASILVVVFSEKCPPKPNLEFWQSKVGYQLNPFAYKDSNNDWIGDIRGLINGHSYIKDSIGAGFVILSSIFNGQYTSNLPELGHIVDYKQIDPALGKMKEFRTMVKQFHRKGTEVVLAIDFNAISARHTWMSDKSLLTPYSNRLGWVSRNGLEPDIINGSNVYYSVDNKLYDLNLTNPKVIEKIKDVLEFWLKENVDGFMLTNCAFYVESETVVVVPQNGTINTWFSVYPQAQLFNEGSVRVVQEMRKVIDAFSSASAKKKLLLVDAGDIGYGLEGSLDRSLMFLGTEKDPGAHLVVHRQFVKNRGWKYVTEAQLNDTLTQPSIKKYVDNVGSNESSLVLPTATEVDLPYSNILNTASIFLLPGTPVVYYGTELGIDAVTSSDPPGTVYPRNKLPNRDTPADESTLTAQLPMPWDSLGRQFNEKANSTTEFPEYLRMYSINETIESVNASGRGPTTFNLITKLIKLRSSPSLLWGKFRFLELDAATTSGRLEAFAREATGYPAFVVVLDNPNLDTADMRTGQVIDFSGVCEKGIVRLSYPERSLKEEMEVDMSKIYITMDTEPSINVFECKK